MQINLIIAASGEVQIAFELEPEESTLEAAFLLENLSSGRLNAKLIDAAAEFGKKTLRQAEVSRMLTAWSGIKASETPCIKPTEVLRMIHGQE